MRVEITLHEVQFRTNNSSLATEITLMEISRIGFYHIKAGQIEKRKLANLANCLYESGGFNNRNSRSSLSQKPQ